MAEPSTSDSASAAALDSGAPSPLGMARQIEDIGARSEKIFADEQAALAPMRKRLTDTLSAPLPHTPKQQDLTPPPRPEDYKKHAMEFASAMAVLGAVSSRFTRSAGNASLNAFASALNGWREGNMQAYEDAAKHWQQATDQTIKNNKMVTDHYKAILENRKINIDQQMALIQTTAAQFQDKITMDAAAAKNYTLVAQIYDKNQEYTRKLEDSKAKLEQNRERDRVKNEEQATYWLSPDGQARLALPEGSPGALTGAQKAGVKQLIEIYGQKANRSVFGRDPQTVSSLADAITSGHQPPVLTSLYGNAAPVRAELEKRGFDLTKADLEYKRAVRQISTLQGPQMTRFVGLAQSVDSTINEVRDLAQQMKLSGVPMLNRAELQSYIQMRGNTPGGQLATRYISAVNTLKEEFASLAQGGYAPTEPVWALANRQINENYGVDQMNASLGEIQRLIRYRVQAIPGLTTVGPAGANRYTGAERATGGMFTPEQPPAETDKGGGWGELRVH